jgi:hypothetical protein
MAAGNRIADDFRKLLQTCDAVAALWEGMRAGIRQAFFHPSFIAASCRGAKVRAINPHAD